MANLSEYTEIKTKVVRALASDRDVVDLITNTNGTVALPATSLIQTTSKANQIHLYDYIPGTTTTAQTHVCIEVHDSTIESVAVGSYELYIYCIVPDDLMVMSGKIRRDALAAAVDSLINNNAEFGFDKVKRLPGRCVTPIEGFRARILRYRLEGWNNNGVTLNAFR